MEDGDGRPRLFALRKLRGKDGSEWFGLARMGMVEGWLGLEGNDRFGFG